jgi:hypothetical protein
MAHEAESANLDPLARTIGASVVPPAQARDLPSLILLASQLFGGEVTTLEDCDPEHPADQFTVLAVVTRLDPAAALEAELEWIRALGNARVKSADIRLSIRFAE